MLTLDLNTGWRLRAEALDCGADRLGEVLSRKDGWMDCRLPCDIHMPLIESGAIGDPVKSDHCYGAEWTSKRSWWFVRTVDGGTLDWDCPVMELTLSGLDAHSDIFINGNCIGRHESVFYPFTADIREYLLPGENTLAVRVTTGLEDVSEADLAAVNEATCTEDGNGRPQRGDKRRAFLRKPAYCVGWDWAPKVVTCGITGGAVLRCLQKAVVRGVSVVTQSVDGDARLAVTVETELLDLYSTADGALTVTFSRDGAVCARQTLEDVLLRSGLNYHDLCVTIPNPALWWPAGYGEQPLYTVDVEVACSGAIDRWPTFEFGIRTVALDTRRDGPDTRRFTLAVNGVPIFCRGGDWIPADSIYARVTAERYEALIKEASQAHFNMLRIWGGGIYEAEAFYGACDRLGILIWHDFMFACTAHPDHLKWFQALVARELDYQTRRLRNHPCLALWCGNNENHWIFNEKDNPVWNIAIRHDRQYGLFTANDQAARAVRTNCPHIPFWNSSPYGGERPNSGLVGDVHHWQAMMNPQMARRIDPTEYDRATARFVTEYGYPGPCARETMEEYFEGPIPPKDSVLWQHHTNTFEKDTVLAGIRRHYRGDADALVLDDYILYAGLTQMTMLNYSLEAFRFKPECDGALFWMYNDTWGEVGWTIVDYSLRRKIAWYGVRRAFAPVRLILREQDGAVTVRGCNDTARELVLPAQIGYISLDGRVDQTVPVTLRLPARGRSAVWQGPLPDMDYTRGLFVVLPQDDRVEPAVLRRADTRALHLPVPVVTVADARPVPEGLEVTLRADTYVHAVHTAADVACDDLYFDLFPGRPRRIVLKGLSGPAPAFTGVAQGKKDGQ